MHHERDSRISYDNRKAIELQLQIIFGWIRSLQKLLPASIPYTVIPT